MGTIMNTTTPLSFNSIDFETPDIKPTMPVPGLRLLCQHCQRPILISDHVYLDVANKRASWKGVDIGLTTGEYRILEFLVERSPHFCTYQELYDRLRGVAGFHVGDTNANVRSLVKRIRKKFLKLDPEFKCIANFISFGYRWVV
jgi:DNA-binding response OmpR family regulator